MLRKKEKNVTVQSPEFQKNAEAQMDLRVEHWHIFTCKREKVYYGVCN